MSVHESGEMYLEAILVLSQKTPFVRSVDVGEYLGYSKPSVSRAMGILREENYITVGKDGGLLLTEKGRDAGKRIAEKIGGILETVSHALTENERIEFYRCLSTISRSLEAIVQNSEEKEM